MIASWVNICGGIWCGYLNWQDALQHQGDKTILVIPSGPADEFETAGLMFTHAINSAQERIWIASPYFVPDQAIIAALKLATLRDVDVRIDFSAGVFHTLRSGY